MKRILASVALLTMLSVGPASAELVIYQFNGPIISAGGGRIIGSVVFDESIPDQDPLSDRTYFPGSIRGLFISTGHGVDQYSVPWETDLTALSVTQGQGGNVFTLTAPMHGGSEVMPGTLILNAPSSILSTVPGLGSITGGTYQYVWANEVFPTNFNGGINRVIRVSEVPLPPAVILFGAGLVALVAFARRRKTNANN